MFLFEKELPNGAPGRFHKAIKMEMVGGATHVIVNSYHKPEMEMICWQDTYVLPAPFSAENLEQVEMLLVQPGAPFGGGAIVAAEPASLDEAKARRWGEVKARWMSLEQTGSAPTPFGRVQCGDASKIKIGGLVQMAQLAKLSGAPFARNFTLADNTTAPVDADGMIALGVAVGTHVGNLHDHAQALRALIYACEAVEDVAAIEVVDGWPGQAVPAPIEEPAE